MKLFIKKLFSGVKTQELEELKQCLWHSQDIEKRCKACIKLGTYKTNDALLELIETLKDFSPHVRISAMISICENWGVTSIPALKKAFDYFSYEATDPRTDMLINNKARVIMTVALIYSKTHDSNAEKLLREMAKCEDAFTAQIAAEFLGTREGILKIMYLEGIEGV